VSLYPYQLRFVADVQGAFRAPLPGNVPCRAVLGQMPCGAGKSASAIEGFVVPSVRRGHRVIFFADLGEILDDAAGRIEAAGARVSVFRAGHRFDPSAQVFVASLQTCARRLDLLPEASRVIVDECHGSEAPTVKAVLARYPGALMLGLTATPSRGDGRPLAEFQRLVCGPTMRELVELGRLVRARVFAPPAVQDRLARDPVEHDEMARIA
jgi:superfamily II DNA or RNA helicase